MIRILASLLLIAFLAILGTMMKGSIHGWNRHPAAEMRWVFQAARPWPVCAAGRLA